MSTVETAVYSDKTYPTGWISKPFALAIANHFSKNSCKILDAPSLRKYLLEAIEGNYASKRIVLFSQDIVPDTICEESHSNTLLREFLDNGGNVIWIGDIPLFYVGIKGAEGPDNCQQAWRVGAPVYMLGIVPVFTSTLKSIDFTHLGIAMGLKHHWTSARPILKNNTISRLGISKNIGSDYYVNVPSEPGQLQGIWKRLRGNASVEVAGFGLKVCFPQMEQTADQKCDNKNEGRHRLYETHVSAWIKCYNSDYPYCGFARIWDYLPRVMPDWKLDEILQFSKNFEKRGL